MPGGLVGDGKLAQVPADHVELHLHVVKRLAVVDSHVGAHHLGQDNSITQVGFNWHWLFTEGCVLLALLALGIESDVFMLDFLIREGVLLENLLRILALKSSTTFSCESSLIWSGV